MHCKEESCKLNANTHEHKLYDSFVKIEKKKNRQTNLMVLEVRKVVTSREGVVSRGESESFWGTG